MARGLQISACVLLAGAAAAIGPISGLRAATSSGVDVFSDDRPAPPDTVDIGHLKPVSRPAPVRVETPLSGNPLWSVPLSVLTATSSRPIFSASRRPPQPAVVASVPATVAAPAPPAAEEPLTLALIGAVVGDGESIAVFLDRSNQKVVRLRPGDSHNGWQLATVEGREVTLKKGSRSETLVIQRQEGSASAPTAANPAGSGVPDAARMPVAGSQNSFAPFVPHHTPRNGESDGL
jgi:general secretion pathway protein N